MSRSSLALTVPGDPTAFGARAVPVSRPGAANAVLSGAGGLALVGGSFALSRMGDAGPWTTALFWAGFVAMLAPIAWYLMAEATPRKERVMLVALAACLTYAVKVLHDPLMFVMPDEFFHLAAAQRILATHALFGHLHVSGGNVVAQYPGLQLEPLDIFP